MNRIRACACALLVAGAMLLLSGCSNAALATDTNASSAETRPVVVAIGDSITKGHGLSAAQAWPAMLAATNGWDLTNLACDGAGFVAAGDDNDCGADFSGLVSEAVALHPALILISGSSNDLGTDNEQLNTETESVVSSLRAKLPAATIVGISTVWNDTVAPNQMDDINEQVRTAILAVKGTYLDIGQPLAGHRSWLQSDDIHPTVRGQQQLAKVIAGAIRSAKLSI
ncbi:SGNH/GDSL hydrolase family protein [Lacisediminihabitans sp. H27-G8]|uniref:SGNH/GDSL hydrolase family protein n=1 Tax=Lacisediminihabitans sp. H27-G8 TaxID=3111909 RepID=UPI0038FCC8A2